MLFFPAGCHAVCSTARSCGPRWIAVAWYVPVAGAVHASTRRQHAGVERARFDERWSHQKAEASGKEDTDDS